MKERADCRDIRAMIDEITTNGGHWQENSRIGVHLRSCEDCSEFDDGVRETVKVPRAAGSERGCRIDWAAVDLFFVDACTVLAEASSKGSGIEVETGGSEHGDWLQDLVASDEYGGSELRIIVDELIQAGWRECGDRPVVALRLANIASTLVGRWRRSLSEICNLEELEARTWTLLGNVRRINSDLRGSAEALRKAEEIEQAHELGAVERVRLLHSKAVLLAEYRDFEGTFRTLDEAYDLAVAIGDRAMIGRLLVSKAAQLGHGGRFEEALVALERAARNSSVAGDAMLSWAVEHNRVLFLCEGGQVSEALAALRTLKARGHVASGEVAKVRSRWVEGKLAAQLERWTEAEQNFSRVRQYFEEQGMLYDYALVSLDLAILYLSLGRTGEVRRIAEELLRIFQALQIERECISAIALLGGALERDQLTLGLFGEVIAAVRSAVPASL